MQQIQKKISAYGLLLLIAMPLLFSVFFLVRQKLIQHAAMENLETSSLQTITIPLADLHWLKEEKEIVLDGKLFDVRSYSIRNGEVSVTGLYDGQEDELLQQVAKLMQQKNGSNAPLNQLIVKFLFSPVLDQPVTFSIESSWRNITRQFSPYTEHTRDEYHSLSAPPPKQA